MNRRLLLNEAGDDDGRISKFAYFFVYWRNPMFYLSLLVAAYSLFSIVIHAIWGFTLGTAVALVSLTMSAWLACAIFDHYGVVERHLSSWAKLKGGFFVLFFAACFAAFVYVQVVQQNVFFASGATDPAWTSFPSACRVASNDTPILNCVRAGSGVPGAAYQPGAGPVVVPPFNASLAAAVGAFQGIMNERGDFRDCELLRQSSNNATDGSNATSVFLHYRCLTSFLGYPDDVAMQLRCVNGAVQLWLHSQSRLGIWDHGVNDARVRLILNYALLPTTWFPFSTELNASSCV